MGCCTENLYVSLSFEITLIKIGNNSTSANSENPNQPNSENCTLPKNTCSTGFAFFDIQVFAYTYRSIHQYYDLLKLLNAGDIDVFCPQICDSGPPGVSDRLAAAAL